MRRICPRCQKRYGDDARLCPNDGSPLRADPFIGSRVDRWTLTDFVGQGAMGVVYAAEPTAAIKILNARRAAMQPDLVRRFEVEAQAASRFASPHIARVFASGTTEDGHLFIAMELLRGEPLDAILERSPTLPPAAAAAIGYQLAGALGEAHAAGVVHRDLKPANIFVEPAPGGGRHVRLLDFGVARINSESVARSRTGSVAGTPAFMSPEQLRGEPDIDGRSDIYSLGVVLYQLLSGANPFRGPGGVMGTLRRHLELVPPPMADITPVLDEVVRRMLAKERDARPQTMPEVQQLLALTGLVHAGGDSVTIPGMSRELLAAVGVYEAAPDPEGRYLADSPQRTDASVGPSVVSDDSGLPATTTGARTAARLSAPEVTTDVHAAQIITRPRRRSRAWLWVALLVVLGTAVGLGVAWVQERPSSPTAAVQQPSKQQVIRLLRDSALDSMQAGRWVHAQGSFDQILELDPEDASAKDGREQAIQEFNHRATLERAGLAVETEQWDEALDDLRRVPKDSRYAARAANLLAEVEHGYASRELGRGRLFIQAGEIARAREVLDELRRRPFASFEATILHNAIKHGPEPAAVAPSRAKVPAPATKTPPIIIHASFDELITQALRRMMKSDRDAAIVLLKKAARKRPSSHLPHQRLCAIYKAKQQYKAALSSCEKWLEREPNASYRPAIQRNVEQLQDLIDQ